MQAATQSLNASAPPHVVPHESGDVGGSVGRLTELRLRFPRRMIAREIVGETGGPELVLYYGDREICFDEPHLFGFARTLMTQHRFVAEQAVMWADGLDWDMICPLLQALLDDGILEQGDAETDDPLLPLDRERPSPLPPAPAATPRDWSDCAAITRDLAGIAIDPGHLELVVPVFRVAHPVLDTDGRQVGEANVFPPALRVERETQWLACTYAGTRHLVDRPMNATALKAMRAHWQQMMAALMQIRSAFLRRFPDVGMPWTVGDVERLAVLVLAVPTHALVRRDGAVASGALHPALSSLFRVTDGLRMVMHQMLFVPIGEPALPPDAVVTADEIIDYAERNYSFHSETGVCAGPRILVRQFLSVLLDGAVPEGADDFAFDAPVADALVRIEEAFDYGLLGLDAHACLFALWPAMARSYEDMAAVLSLGVATGHRRWEGASNRLAEILDRLSTETFLGTEERRAQRDRVYGDMRRQCRRGLSPALRDAEPSQTLASPEEWQGLVEAIVGALVTRSSHPADLVMGDLARVLADFALTTQAILRRAVAAQDRVNAHLGRPRPRRGFTSVEADAHNRLQGGSRPRFPYIFDEIEALLGLRLHVSPDTVTVQSLPSSRPTEVFSPRGADWTMRDQARHRSRT